MERETKTELVKQIKADYHKKLKVLESALAVKHKELSHLQQSINHEEKKIYKSKISTLRAKKVELDASILKLKKEIKQIKKAKEKKLKKLKKS